ncbi:hypothetical protein [Pedobacter jamesrossensis]|uniref:Uncharacterized protein n=1 Tax=Pedobacter jamesrossensis TaxID=1908238 RepID=A0ABV8NHS5_9SPHI
MGGFKTFAIDFVSTEEGWIADSLSPTGLCPYFRAYANFEPKMDGQTGKRWWDGSIHSYSPQPNNHKGVYQTGPYGDKEI